MALTKYDVRIIYLALKVIEGGIPYPDEIEEILDNFRSMFDTEEMHDIDNEIDEIFASEEFKAYIASHVD